jgi:polyisoprenoid-binding protein YceI
MTFPPVHNRWLSRTALLTCLQKCLSTLLLLTSLTVIAAVEQPCQPFEGGRVDARLLEAMRRAASEGRLYRVDPEESKVGFCVRHFPQQELRGEFTNIVGGLVMPSLTHQYGQALLLIHTTPMKASNQSLAPLIMSHEFMDTGRHPEILFTGRAFEWLGPLQGYIYGDLTLRGITQPMVFRVSIEILEEGLGGLPDRIWLQGNGQVSRYQFNMRSHRIMISETVELCLDVELVPWGP